MFKCSLWFFERGPGIGFFLGSCLFSSLWIRSFGFVFNTNGMSSKGCFTKQTQTGCSRTIFYCFTEFTLLLRFFICIPWVCPRELCSAGFVFFSDLTHGEVSFLTLLAEVTGTLCRVRSQLAHLFGLECLFSPPALAEFAGLLMWCWNLFLLDSYSWLWSASSKEEVSISTVSNALWRYIFMAARLIAAFVPRGVWLFNKHSRSREPWSDFTARLPFAKARGMRQPNWISGWSTLIYAR